jgi:hypothetical protein
MQAMMTLYLICLLSGVLFAVLSLILSGGFEADVGHDVDFSADAGVDGSGDIAGHDVGAGEVHFPLFSPVVIASFVAAFGAGGIIGLTGWLLMFINKNAESGDVTRADSLIGSVAEVTETIPADGVGEIMFSGRSERINGPARSEEKKDIKRHAMVTITRVVGGLYWVREHVDEKLRDVETTEKS